MKQSEYLKTLKLAKRSLQEYKNWGEDEIYKSSDSQNAGQPTQELKKQMPIQKSDSRQQLEALSKKVAKCRDCDLGASRITAVFGEGSPNAELMFVGEGPGFEEDHKGRPFIGKAGQFLTNLIELMGYNRESVYIANIVKCHPMKDPSNPELRSNDRPPTNDEVLECCKYLEEQISIINPKVIVTLGRPSICYFLKSEVSMSSVRGIFRDYKGIKLMPTYHPSYLIRNGCVFGKKDQAPQVTKLKKEVWSDLKKVMDYLKTGKV